jgi:NAD(P)H-hydrate epimerase
VRRLLEEVQRPAVVDADALYDLDPFERSSPTVLTPHEGELSRLLGVQADWVAAHRLEAVRRAAENFGCVCVLKGADTLIATPGQGVLVSSLGSPALATAGSGDVLTGIVAAFLAKGLEPRLAAAAAVAAQQLASTLIPQSGAIASDVIGALPLVLNAPV